jgi:hypothetical protein
MVSVALQLLIEHDLSEKLCPFFPESGSAPPAFPFGALIGARAAGCVKKQKRHDGTRDRVAR